MRTTITICKALFFLSIVAFFGLVFWSLVFDPPAHRSDVKGQVQLINVSEAELHKMHVENNKKLFEIVQLQGKRISELEAKIDCLEKQTAGFQGPFAHKPIVPGVPPPGVPGPVETLPFPKEKK